MSLVVIAVMVTIFDNGVAQICERGLRSAGLSYQIVEAQRLTQIRAQNRSTIQVE